MQNVNLRKIAIAVAKLAFARDPRRAAIRLSVELAKVVADDIVQRRRADDNLCRVLEAHEWEKDQSPDLWQ